jgi:hypothetical protein
MTSMPHTFPPEVRTVFRDVLSHGDEALKLKPNELQTILVNLGMAPPQASKLLASIQMDASGLIDLEEFLAQVFASHAKVNNRQARPELVDLVFRGDSLNEEQARYVADHLLPKFKRMADDALRDLSKRGKERLSTVELAEDFDEDRRVAPDSPALKAVGKSKTDRPIPVRFGSLDYSAFATEAAACSHLRRTMACDDRELEDIADSMRPMRRFSHIEPADEEKHRRQTYRLVAMHRNRHRRFKGSYAKLIDFLEECAEGDLIADADYHELQNAIERLSGYSHLQNQGVAADEHMFEGHEDAVYQVLPAHGIRVAEQEIQTSCEEEELDAAGPTADVPDVLKNLNVCMLLARWLAKRRQSIPAPQTAPQSVDLTQALETLQDPQFDRLTACGQNVHVDLQIFWHALTAWRLVERYNLDAGCTLRWAGAIHDLYKSDVSYHNWSHAFDVFQFTSFTLSRGDAKQYFSHQEILVLFCAALGHDVGHPGLTNLFLSASDHALALRYNDKSILENFHAATFFETLMLEGNNFTQSMRRGDYDKFREKIVDCILATDMSHHFNLCDRLAARMCEEEHVCVGRNSCMDERTDGTARTTQKTKDDRRLLMQSFTHMADLGHTCRPFHVHKRLVALLEEEFFRQGDECDRLGLPIPPMMNRNKDSQLSGQAFFLDRVVRPLVDPYCMCFNEEVKNFVQGTLDDNTAKWKEIVEQHCKDRMLTVQEFLMLQNEEAADGANLRDEAEA